jgi:hypothetical protein
VVLFNWLAKACELISNDNFFILEPYWRRNVFYKTCKIDAVFDLTENNKYKNKDNRFMKQVTTFQKDKKLKDG